MDISYDTKLPRTFRLIANHLFYVLPYILVLQLRDWQLVDSDDFSPI